MNPAGKVFTEEDYKTGVVQQHVDELHALTLEASAPQANRKKRGEKQELSPATFHFRDLPDDVVSLVPPFLTHWEAREFGSTSRRNSLIVTDHPGFTLTRQALTSGLLRLTRQLMEAIHRHEAKVDAITPSYLNELDGDEYFSALDKINSSTHQVALDGARNQWANHVTPEREAQIRQILDSDPGHQTLRLMLQRSDLFLEQLDSGQFASIEQAALREVAGVLDSFGQGLLADAVALHESSPDEHSATQLRHQLVALRQRVLVEAASGIVAGSR